jgi:hypothetical protein
MRLGPRSFQRFLSSRRDRMASRPRVDALDELAPESGSVRARGDSQDAGRARRNPVELLAAAGQPAPRTVARTASSIPWRTVAIVASVALAVALAGSIVAIPDTAPPSEAFVAPAASPIEVEYPDYPGAPLLEAAATAMPARLTPEAAADQSAVGTRPQAVATLPADSPRPPDTLRLPTRLQSDVPGAFGVRGAIPQIASVVPAVATVPVADQPIPGDAPPRRIGPPLAITAVGGAATRNGRVVLVLEITENGEVARILSREAVDVHPDVADSVADAARTWRYEPARRDGVPVPARVRVVVELNGRH